jgi:hypothetical protein
VAVIYLSLGIADVGDLPITFCSLFLKKGLFKLSAHFLTSWLLLSFSSSQIFLDINFIIDI